MPSAEHAGLRGRARQRATPGCCQARSTRPGDSAKSQPSERTDLPAPASRLAASTRRHRRAGRRRAVRRRQAADRPPPAARAREANPHRPDARRGTRPPCPGPERTSRSSRTSSGRGLPTARRKAWEARTPRSPNACSQARGFRRRRRRRRESAGATDPVTPSEVSRRRHPGTRHPYLGLSSICLRVLPAAAECQEQRHLQWCSRRRRASGLWGWAWGAL